MPLYIPNADTGFVHAGAEQLAARLKVADPDLELRMRVIEHPNKPGIKGRRYEVWRHVENGQDLLLGHWRLEEFDQIETDLQIMKAGAEGRIDNVEQRIDKVNDAKDRDDSSRFRDNYGAMLEHAKWLAHDLFQPKHTFRGIPGLRDVAKDTDGS